MASKTKLRNALKKARQSIVELLPKDSERKILVRLNELLEEECKAAAVAMEELEREGEDESHDYGELLGVRAMIRKVKDCIDGKLES